MTNNLGKWFYVSDLTEAAKPDTYKFLRLMSIRCPYEGKTVCDTETNLMVALSDSYLIGPTVDKDYLLNCYTAISPQLVAYYIEFKDAPAFDSLYIVLEPYDLESEEQLSSAISVYPALSTLRYAANDHVFACHKRRDAVEYFMDTKGYKECTVGPLVSIYYNDKPQTIVGLTLCTWTKEPWYSTRRTLIANRNSFASLAKQEIDKDIKASSLAAFHSLRTNIQAMHMNLLNLMPLTNKDVFRLHQFVEYRDLNDEALSVLTQILRFESKSNAVNEEEVINDVVFQKSIIIMQYDLNMDLENIKRNNRMYTLVLGKTTDNPRLTYIILYRRAPVEFRSQTGFSQDEMVKLLS